MVTEEETREAADEKEVLMEAVDLEPHLDSKLSSMDIKNVAETIDSIEGTLKILEDQVLVDASSGIKLPLENYLNGTSSSLNGHVDKENKISNEQLHKDSKKDQQTEQADTKDADAVQDDVPKHEETCVSEMTTEHADDSTIDAQEALHQEDSEDTNGPAYEKKEQTSQQSSMAASDDTTSEHDSTTCEPPVDIQVQNKKSLEEMKDVDAVDTEVAMQESCIDFEKVTPEYHVATMEQDSVEKNSTESAETQNVKTVPSYDEGKVANGVTVRGPMTDSQGVDNVGSTEEIMNNVADNIVEVTNVAAVDEANKEKNMLRAEDIAEKHMPEIESKVTKSIEPIEIEEDSDQKHVSLLDESAQGDNTPESMNQHTGSALEINETEATITEAVAKESDASEEPSPEDHVTESKITSDAKEINTIESLEAIKGDKDTKTREMPNQNNMNSSGKSAQENNAPESEPTSEIQPEQEPESEEMNVTDLAQVNESSPEITATTFYKEVQENNTTTSELHILESGGMRNIEATEVQATPHQLNSDNPEEKATEKTITSSEPQTLELESVEKMNDIKAIKPQDVFQQSIISPSAVPEETSKEDTATVEPDDGHHQPQDPELAEFDEIKTNKSQEIASSSILSNYEVPTSEDSVALTEPNPETQAENSEKFLSAEVMEDTENVKGHDAPAGEGGQKENVETKAIVDIAPVQEPELEEAKNNEPVGTEDNIAPSDLPTETMEKETVEVEAIPYESPTASIREVNENDIVAATTPHADIQPVLKQESVEDKCTNTTENSKETQQIVGSTSDKHTPTDDNMATAEPACETPLQNVIAQGIKDSEDTQTDQFSNLDSFLTPGEAVQESKLPRMEPTSDVQEVKELGSTVQTRGIEAMETEDLKQHRVTLEEPAVDKKQNVHDYQVHEEKPAELKDNEAMEAEPVLEQSNISNIDNAPDERSELGNDPDCCVQPAKQVEPSKGSEDNKLLKGEETLDQKIITLEDTATEDIDEDQIDPPVGMEQEHEQKSLETSDVLEVQDLGSAEQTRGIEAMETEGHQQHRVSIIEEPTVDNKPNIDDHQVHEEKPAELKNNEAMEAEVIEQSNISTPDNAHEERSELQYNPDCCVQPAQHIESSRDSEDSKLLKEEETSGQKIIILEETATKDVVQDEIDPPVGMEQEHEQKSFETSDLQEAQDLGSAEQTRGIEAMETEGHQQHRVSILEEPAVDNKPNVDDHQVREEKPAELKDNEAMEAEVIEQINISTPDNAPEERSELPNDPDCCIQPAQKVESSRDSEESKLLKDEETSDQKIITLEDTATEDIVEDEINPPVIMEKEHEQKPVEEVKDISASEAKEDLHTSQSDALDKLASESNTATTEPTYDIKHLSDFETKEIKSFEGINDGHISCEQTEFAASVTPSPTANEIAQQEHPMESHEENLGNEPENAVLAHGMENETQTSAEQKDNEFHLGGTVPTTKKSKNLADENVIQTSGEDTLESSNSTDQIKEGEKAGFEHISSQKSSEHPGENITQVQDKNINGEPVTQSAEASQALIENDAQALQDITEKDDTMRSVEQTNDHRKAGDVEQQLQTCESSVDDESVRKVSLDEQHKEDEEVQSQKEQLQADEQKHKDEGDDVNNMPLVETKNTENGTTNRTEETYTSEAGQTETAVNEILKIEQALQTSDDSTLSITDTTVEDITGTDKRVEEGNRPNSANISDADAKMVKQEDKETTEKDNIVPVDFTSGQNETTDENTNEELEPTLASSIQQISHTSPSEDQIQEIDPIAVPCNAEFGGHEDKECTDKVKDYLLAIQEPEKEIVAGMQENREIQNETTGVHHAETKAEEEEMSQLPSNEPYNVDTKIDDTTHNKTVQPREIEEIGENKELSSIYKPVVETSEKDNVEQDLSIHYKVEDEKMESTEDNAVELEATQQKVDTLNVDTDNDDHLYISNSLTKHEIESADDFLQPETEGNTFDKADETVSYEKTETNNTSFPETVTFNEEICDKVTGAEGGLSDETVSLKIFDDTRRNLDVSSVVTESNEERMYKEMDEHKLAAPAHPIINENTPKQVISVSEKPLPTEPYDQEDDQIHKEQDEEDMHESDFADAQKEVEQDLPVSNFLMNLILGKENSDANEHSEPEAETKQEETRDDNSCLIIPKQVESSALPPKENNVEDKLTVEQETEDVKCFPKHEVVEEQSHDANENSESEAATKQEETRDDNSCLIILKQVESSALPPKENSVEDKLTVEQETEDVKCFPKHEVVEEQSHDLKLGAETSLETDVELNKNSHHLELPPYQDKAPDEISNEILSEEAAEIFTKKEVKDIAIPNITHGDREVDTVCQENTQVATQNEIGSFKNNLDDLSNTKIPAEETLGEGQTRLLPECLNEARSVNSVTEQTLLLTESGMSDVKSLPSEADSVPNPVCEIQDNAMESSSIGAASIHDIQVESEEDKTEEKQPTTTAAGEVAEEHVEISNDNPQKSIGPEATFNEQEHQIAEQVSDTKIALGHENEIYVGSSMDTKEDSNVSVKEGTNIQTAVEIQADSSYMQINQDKQDTADNKIEIESEKLEESNIQEKQGNGSEEKSSKECHEEDQQFLVNKETVIKEGDVHEAVKSHTETVKIKANSEQELSDLKVQERDLDVFSPKDVHKPEGSFADTAKPEFSIDEEQSPRADESNMSEQKTYEGKTNDEERIKNFTDEEMKTEAQIAGQKAAHKKQNLLSGVGSKVKHQLAKVKKAITGKPGHTKPKSPKA